MTIELNRIYNEDCVEGMRRIADNSVRVVIADPPYGVNYRSNFRSKKFDKIQHDDIISTDWLTEAHRTLQEGGALYCYTRWDVLGEWKSAVESAGFKVKNVIVWYKRGGGLGDLRGAYMFNHELIIYAVKGRHILNGKRTSDVWEIQKDAATSYIHPTQKPVSLAERILEKSSNPGDTVLIPFGGSGSDCVAAVSLSRNYIAFELDAEYADKATERLSAA